MAPRQKKPEEILSEQVINALRKRRVYFFHPANEGRRTWYEAKTFHVNGGLAGVADLVLLLPGGRCVFVELKAGRNKQEKSQIAFEAEVTARGFEYYIWRSADEAVAFCNQLTREGVHAKATGIL